MNKTELAWAAGFFDGEGSIYIVKDKSRHRVRGAGHVYSMTSVALAVAQVKPEPLQRFAKAVGGRKPGGPYQHKNNRHSSYYRWDACGRPSVHKIIVKLWPYLSKPKKEQIQKCWKELERLKHSKSPNLPELPK